MIANITGKFHAERCVFRQYPHQFSVFFFTKESWTCPKFSKELEIGWIDKIELILEWDVHGIQSCCFVQQKRADGMRWILVRHHGSKICVHNGITCEIEIFILFLLWKKKIARENSRMKWCWQLSVVLIFNIHHSRHISERDVRFIGIKMYCSVNGMLETVEMLAKKMLR